MALMFSRSYRESPRGRSLLRSFPWNMATTKSSKSDSLPSTTDEISESADIIGTYCNSLSWPLTCRMPFRGRPCSATIRLSVPDNQPLPAEQHRNSQLDDQGQRRPESRMVPLLRSRRTHHRRAGTSHRPQRQRNHRDRRNPNRQTCSSGQPQALRPDPPQHPRRQPHT